ncbi:MAG TPA: restriction endonuclease subunit S [archaeon]|nr:restriction endonuclease subunit S [archaeon]
MKQPIKFKQTEIGLIPEDWDFGELEKHSKIIMGQSPESKYYNSNGNGTLFLQGVRTFGLFFPTYDTWTTKITKLAKKDSVLLSVRAPVGEVNIADKELCIGRGLLSINGECNLYIFYLFKAFKDYVINKETGTVYGSVTRGDIAKLKFPFPKVNEQKAIASILSSFDDKIELLEKQNETLEKIGEALFKQWFVNFEFPDENGKPYKSSGGKMIWSEELKKEIPVGLMFVPLSEVTDNILRGFTTEYVEKSGLINLNQKVNRGGYLDKSNFKYYPENAVVPSEKFAKKWDLLINSLGQGTIGRIHIYLENTTNVVVDQHISIIRANSKLINPQYLYYYLIFNENNAKLMDSISGSTGMLMLNISAVRSFKVLIPGIESLNLFEKQVVSLLEKKGVNNLQIESLKQTRDLLLSKLMGGKIRVV